MAKLISKTYGDALFELAVEESKVDVFEQEIEVLHKILDENKDFEKMMLHPEIIKEDKIRVMEDVFKERISGELTGFLKLVILKDRYREVGSILLYFRDRVKALKGIGVAYVSSAAALSKMQKMQIEEKLLATTGYQKMEMHYGEDSSLIGGIVIQIGDRVVDSSIAAKLRELQKQLLKIQLA